MSEAIAKPVNGRWVAVIHGDSLMVGTVVDCVAGEPEKPKRVRIQRGALQGQVLMPTDYVFKGFLEDKDIDP